MRSCFVSRIMAMGVILGMLMGCAGAKRPPEASKEQVKSPYLKLRATPIKLVHPGLVTATATIVGPIQWCPEKIVWDFAGERSSKDALDCYERTWQITKRIKFTGKNLIRVVIISNGVIAGTADIEVELIRMD